MSVDDMDIDMSPAVVEVSSLPQPANQEQRYEEDSHRIIVTRADTQRYPYAYGFKRL